MRKQDAAHHREMALNTLSEIANVFDFPDLNRFLSVSCNVCLVDLFEVFYEIFHLFKENLTSTLKTIWTQDFQNYILCVCVHVSVG